MEDERLDMQKLSYFTEGNTFTGSRTKDWDKGVLLRYLVRPDREEEKLTAYSWTEDVCFERAQERREEQFPLNEEGLESIQAWLQEQYRAL